MNTSLTLSDISLESNEALVEDVRADDANADPILNPMQSKEYDDMLLVFETYRTIVERKYICRSDLERIKDLSGDYPSLGKLVKKYPINSFSEEPSRINYDVSTESFVRTAYEAVVKAFKDVLAFLVNSMRRLWAFLSSNGQRTEAVDEMGDNLSVCQKYILEVDRVMATTSAEGEFKKVRKGAFEDQQKNVSKRWNAFKDMMIQQPSEARELMETIAGVLKVNIPPFVTAVENFLDELGQAETDVDVRTAIGKMAMVNLNTGSLVKLAAKHGYRANKIAVDPRMTNFHSLAGYIASVFRSWENQRQDISPTVLQEAVTSMKIDNWSDEINATIKWGNQRTDSVLKKIAEFKSSELKPGMEDVYTNELVPFFRFLTSSVQGFTTLESCLGMLVTNRDNAVILILHAAIRITKVMDASVEKNKDVITLGGRAVVASKRRAVKDVFKK